LPESGALHGRRLDVDAICKQLIDCLAGERRLHRNGGRVDFEPRNPSIANCPGVELSFLELRREAGANVIAADLQYLSRAQSLAQCCKPAIRPSADQRGSGLLS
jgi:hypothetical protein